jgi:hypothetical protein
MDDSKSFLESYHRHHSGQRGICGCDGGLGKRALRHGCALLRWVDRHCLQWLWQMTEGWDRRCLVAPGAKGAFVWTVVAWFCLRNCMCQDRLLNPRCVHNVQFLREAGFPQPRHCELYALHDRPKRRPTPVRHRATFLLMVQFKIGFPRHASRQDRREPARPSCCIARTGQSV